MVCGRQGSFTTIALERHEVAPDGAQLRRSFEVELMRGGPDFIALMLRVYALENEAAELRATTISLRKTGDEPYPRSMEDSWSRPSQPDRKLQEELANVSARYDCHVDAFPPTKYHHSKTKNEG